MPLENDSIPEPPVIDLLVQEIELAKQDPEASKRIQDAVGVICGTLEKLADEQVQKKSAVEKRWVEDLRQYHGRYDPDTEQKLKAADQSKVFANLTRPKTNAWAARISDILFPTDDKNWAIGPTPVPELATKLATAKFEARRLSKRANVYAMLSMNGVEESYKAEMQAKAEEFAKQAAPHAQTGAELDQIMDEAKAKAKAMESEIEDQQVEARYGEKARVGIKDMTQLGNVVMKGPLSKTRVRGKWLVENDTWKLDAVSDPRPDWQRVDLWSYFPDMNARTVDEAEFHFERHLWTKRDLKRLARKPGFDRDVIREVLKSEAKAQPPNYLQQIREITGNQNVSLENRYVGWEYSGPLKGSEIDSIARAIMPPEDAAAVIRGLKVEEDPLKEQLVVLWFVDGKPIKFAPHPLDSGDSIYSVSCFVEDPTSIFGFGVPYLARNAQAIINAAWRLMMDNADMSVGPQVVINRNVLEPADQSWNLRGFKEWLYIPGKTLPPGSPEPFQTFQTNSNLQYLLEVIRMAMVFLDEEISLPMIAQGEQGAKPTDTAQGMSMLMNAANVIFRDAVRNWDDKITVPDLTRAYDWNMQHSTKDYIKGDMEIKARGSSVLLVRDMQSQNLGMFLTQFGANPIYGPFVKHVDGLRELSKTMMLDSAKLVKSDEEIEKEAQEREMNPPPPGPDEIKLQIAQEDNQTKQNIAGMTLHVRMLEYAQKGTYSIDQINAMLMKADKDRASKERLAAVDAALTQRQMAVKAAEPHPNISTTGTVQ